MRARVQAAVAVAALALLGAGCGKDEPQAMSAGNARTVTVSVGDERVRAELAETADQHTAGLSGRPSLGADEGMLFVFPARGSPSFWMKGMRFPIDIVWIAGGRVTEVTARVPPPPPGTVDRELPLYSPRRPIDSALEVNAGWARRHGVEAGDAVEAER